ncbi:MAG: hypothetical protein AAF581_10425 [Planctomycetota bacterium]
MDRWELTGAEFDWFAVDSTRAPAVFATAGYGFVPANALAMHQRHVDIAEAIPQPNYGTPECWDDFAAAGLFVYDWGSGPAYTLVRTPGSSGQAGLLQKIATLPSVPQFGGRFSAVDAIREEGDFCAQVTPYVRIKRVPYEEPHRVNLIVEASDGSTSGQLLFYSNASDILEVAKSLDALARQPGEDVTWQLGSMDPAARFAFYFCLRACHAEVPGSCSVELSLRDNVDAPDDPVTKISIATNAIQLQLFASLLAEFGGLEHAVLDWTTRDGLLRKDV